MFERFSIQARQVIVLAQDEARALNHNYIGTEHILIGVLREGDGDSVSGSMAVEGEEVTRPVLRALGISLEAVRRKVEEIIGHGQAAPTGHIPYTPRAKKVLEWSLREGIKGVGGVIRPEHILLGIVDEALWGDGQGVAALVLESFEVDLRLVRRAVIDHPSSDTGDGDAASGQLR